MGLALTSVTSGASIRDVDFKNFAYLFPSRKFLPVPSKLRWMPLTGAKVISVSDGQYTTPCEVPGRCPSLWLNKVDFGNIHGVPGISAIVTVWYSTGGTANWQYLYVIALRGGKPQVVAWLRTGSRADMGLRRAKVDSGDLILVVNNPDKRMGDCCSTGTITYRYQWHVGSFRQISAPVLADDPK